MELRHIETFVRVADLKSFTKAGDELCITQPTVSKQILDLEHFLDIRLIDRTKRTVTLTKAGDILLKYARDILSLKNETIDAIASFKGLKQGKITVGASTVPGIFILPAILATFRSFYGGIKFELIVSDTKEITGKMEEGLLDIGIVGAKSPKDKIEYKKLVDDTIILIAPLDFPDTIELSRLKDYPFIARERGSATRNAFESMLLKQKNTSKDDLSVVAELSDNGAVKEAVKNGMGIACISNIAVKDELSSGTLKRVTVNGLPDTKRSFYVIIRKGKTVLPQVKALMEIIDQWRKNEKA